MAHALSKNRQGPKGTTQDSAADSEPVSKFAESMMSRITPWGLVELFGAGNVFVVALVLYSWTLAPTVTLTDSGELIVVARGLGIAHPPGVPLWIILAHLASLMPFGNIAMRDRSEEHTSELQSQSNLVCRLLLEKKKAIHRSTH